MNGRTEALRRCSLEARPSLSAERALLVTRFYRENDGRWSVPVMRARSFLDLCEKKTIHLGEGELIVGERGPSPKAVPTFPELTCHSLEDLRILDLRPKTSYAVGPEVLEAYEREVIPYWRGRSLREKLFAALPAEWHALYEAGLFTEFMEQRAPGHTVLDDKIYGKGLLDFKADIARAQKEGAAAALQQAQAAEKPAAETGPLRERVSRQDIDAAEALLEQVAGL